jgi:RNA 3'-terminal phosphate cyclase
MVEACIEHLQKELAHGGCVDEFLEDQIVVFQALAEGESKVDGAEWRKGKQGKVVYIQERLGGLLKSCAVGRMLLV